MLTATFCGANKTVTGSMHHFQYSDASGKFNFIVDAGMFQTGEDKNLFDVNSGLIYDPKDLDCVILTHAHLDHCGRLPYLVKNGFDGIVYSTPATMALATIVMMDSAKINSSKKNWRSFYKDDVAAVDMTHSEDTELSQFDIIASTNFLIKGDRRVGLYSKEEVDKALTLFQTKKYRQKFKIHPNLEIEFFDAGHILGSSYLIITELSTGRKIALSGDMGNINKPIIEDPFISHNQDGLTHIYTETTYGDNEHSNESSKSQLQEVVTNTIKKRGKVLIPTFALERTQEVIYYIVELMRQGKIPKTRIYLDSPMASKVTVSFQDYPNLYDKEMRDKVNNDLNPFSYDWLHIIGSSQESKTLNYEKGSCIIIAGSGMMTGGRILKHLRFHAPNKNNAILITGYQAVGTTGREIQEGSRVVEIDNELVQINAKVETIKGLSAHADKNMLKKWIENLLPRSVFSNKSKLEIILVHGQESSSQSFGRVLKKAFNNDNISSYIPSFGESRVLWE